MPSPAGRGRPVPVRPALPPSGWTAGGKDRQPPNAVRSRFVPASAEATSGSPSGRPGRRSARGYPAAVSTPVGADPAVVGPYLAGALGDERWRSVDIELIAAGMSNLTYVVTPEGGSAGRRGHPAPPADRARSSPPRTTWRGSTGSSPRSGPTDVPVPRTLHLCTDESVLGAPFYVMERVVGIHVVQEFPPGYADEPAQRRAVGESLIDVLADLHTVDYDAVGLVGVRPAGGFRRPPGPALDQAVGRHPRPRPPGPRRPRRPAGRDGADRAAVEHRPRRLPAGQLPARPRRRPGASAPSSTGRCPRSVIRSPTSG